MKYLVTGGLGFLGSHLVERLLKEEGQIVVIDDMSMGSLDNIPKNKRIEVHKASILDDGMDYFKDVDVVFHLAALTRPQWSIENPEESNRTNVDGTVRVFAKAKEAGVQRVVFVSSSSLYGENVYPTPESATPNPMSPYALQKYIGEQYARLFEKLYGMEINYIRPFNVYGSRQSPEGSYAAAVPNFIRYLRTGRTPWITGDGEQRRDFIYVDDVVEIILRASECLEHGEAFNAGFGKNISINELYRTVCRVMKKDVKPDYVPAFFEPTMTLSEMSKVKKMLDFEPKINLEEGLSKTIASQ